MGSSEDLYFWMPQRGISTPLMCKLKKNELRSRLCCKGNVDWHQRCIKKRTTCSGQARQMLKHMRLLVSLSLNMTWLTWTAFMALLNLLPSLKAVFLYSSYIMFRLKMWTIHTREKEFAYPGTWIEIFPWGMSCRCLYHCLTLFNVA